MQYGRASLKTGCASLKTHQESIGLRKVLEMCRMVEFLQIQLFHVKFHICIENIKTVIAEIAKIKFSAPARPGCARSFETNAIPSLFRGSRRPGAHFRKKSLFHKIIARSEKDYFVADFRLLMKS